MSRRFQRDIHSEASRHFQGTPQERLLLALELGRRALALFMANLPPGTSEDEARKLLRKAKQYGRRRSRIMEGRQE